MNTLRIRGLAVLSAAVLCASGALAQSAQPKPEKKEESLAELARRARAERERRTTSQPLREFTNDTLPPVRVGAASVPAGPQGTTDATTPSAPGTAGTPSEADEQERSEADAAVKAEKEKLEKLKKEAELMERETALNKAAFYGRPDYSGDSAGAARLAAQDAAIASKKTEISETQTKIAELEEKAKSIHDRLGPKPEEPKSPEQQRDAWAEKTRPLRNELARIEAEITAIQQERTAQGSTTNPAGGFTGDRIAQLERRRGELQRQIADIEDDARRAGTLPVRN